MGVTVREKSRGHGLDVEIKFVPSSERDVAMLEELKKLLASGAADRKQGKQALVVYALKLDDVFEGITLCIGEETIRAGSVDHLTNPEESSGKFQIVIVGRDR